MEFTKKQEAAIFAEDCDVIISAAAGSGKTTVLAQRVLYLCRKGASVENMLICTYTRAAAAELKRRIASCLEEEAYEKGDARLLNEAQKTMIAQIGTIHSFCSQVLADNCAQAGLKQGWRTGTEALAGALKKEALEDTVTRLYEEDDEELMLLCAKYGGRTDKQLLEKLLHFYDTLRSQSELFERQMTPELYRQRILDKAADYVIAKLKGARAAAKDLCEFALVVPEFSECNKQGSCELDSAEIMQQTALDIVKNCLELIEQKGLEDINAIIEQVKKYSPIRLKNGLPEQEKAYYGEIKDTIKGAFGDIASCLTMLTDIEAEAQDASKVANAFLSVCRKLDEQYTRLKESRNILDYDDLIIHARRLLKQEAIARIYRDKFEYVFIDEYQDTNRLQDSILETVSRPGCRFIVGDVKQSIYSFRYADPTVFTDKIASLGENGKVVYMNDNFRSRPAVIDYVNETMGELMEEDFGGVEYTGGERLAAAIEGEGKAQMLAALCEDGEDPYTAEARLLAQEISRKIKEGTPAGQIAILLRSMKRAEVIKTRLELAGVPVTVNGQDNTPVEIALFVDLLRIIDSSNNDIPLIAVLRLMGFTEEELALMRIGLSEGSFFSALYKYAEEGNQKAAQFVGWLKRMRLIFDNLPLKDSLIHLKNSVDYEVMMAALPGDDMKAAAFESFFASLIGLAEEGSLTALLSALEEQKERSGSYMQKTDGLISENNVNIMTIHKSKGLQFGVVYVAQLHAQFNEKDVRAKVLLGDEENLVATDLYDTVSMTVAKTVSRTVVAEYMRLKGLSEQLRALYVAMTRAERELYLTCGLKGIPALKYKPKRNAHHFTDWLPLWQARIIRPAQEETTGEAINEQACEVQLCDIGFERVPVKMGVSSLMSDYEVSNNAPVMNISYEPLENQSEDFGTDFGTLIHFFMQHYDYKADIGVERTLDSLIKRRLITEEERLTITRFKEYIEAYLESPLADRVRNAIEIYKELPFSLGVSAQELGYLSDETVIVQGIIDLVIKEADGYTIIDYKTNLSRDYKKLKEHYSVQMAYYRRAFETAKRVSVKECVLTFLRTGVNITL